MPPASMRYVGLLFLVSLTSPVLAQQGQQPIAQPGVADPVRLPRVWANNGEDKVTRSELRATADPSAVHNRVWDGTRVELFGARNEAVSFNVILEAGAAPIKDVTVSFDSLEGPGGAVIRSNPTDPADLFNSVGRDIELFYVRYLQVKGLSLLSYGLYDERHIPSRLRRPHDANGFPQSGTDWSDRPDADAFYPDIAVPLESQGAFRIPAQSNQSIWVDIHIPRDAAHGLYSGTLRVAVGDTAVGRVPVDLEVRDMQLPDEPTARTMVFLGHSDINLRHLGVSFPDNNTPEAALSLGIRDNYFKVLRRHRLMAFDNNEGAEVWGLDRPRDHWVNKLNGSFYTPANGYSGPGEGVGHDFFVVGSYGSWSWKNDGEAAMHQRTDGWMSWFDAQAPGVEVMLYLIDEAPLSIPDNVTTIQTWLAHMESNTGPGAAMKSFLTTTMPEAMALFPTLDIATSWARVEDPQTYEPAFDYFKTGDRQAFIYNGIRPTVGSFATEDDGVALRVVPWTQFKKGIDRYFFWESTFYFKNVACSGPCQTDLFKEAQTFGGFPPQFDSIAGDSSFNHSNGDGVLLYPGTDQLYPEDSYGLDGPLASLRLKHWRRGLQDVEYLTQAQAIDPAAVAAIVDQIVPSVLWEVGVTDPADPTYVRSDISWSTDPDVWEAARAALADIIDP